MCSVSVSVCTVERVVLGVNDSICVSIYVSIVVKVGVCVVEGVVLNMNESVSVEYV